MAGRVRAKLPVVDPPVRLFKPGDDRHLGADPRETPLRTATVRVSPPSRCGTRCPALSVCGTRSSDPFSMSGTGAPASFSATLDATL